MVIQRWQSVFLLIGAVAMALFAFLPAACSEMGGVARWYWHPIECVPLFVLDLLTAVLALIAIFMYKNLRAQKRVALVVAFLSLVAMVATVWAVVSIRLEPVMLDVPFGMEIDWPQYKQTMGLRWPVGLPLVAAVFFVWANRRMRADERLLRSYDRLR